MDLPGRILQSVPQLLSCTSRGVEGFFHQGIRGLELCFVNVLLLRIPEVQPNESTLVFEEPLHGLRKVRVRRDLGR